MSLTTETFGSYLEPAVILLISDLTACGGPAESDWNTARAFGRRLGSEGDRLLFGGGNGQASELYQACAHAVAVLSFCPGGITIFSRHWESR